MRDQNTTTATAYNVSEQTANLIKCLDTLDTLYNQLYYAVEPLMGSSTDAELEEIVMPKIADIREYVEKMIGRSVCSNHSIIGSKDI